MPALVGKLAEVNHILEYFVDRLQEIAGLLAVGAAYVFCKSDTTLLLLLNWILSWSGKVIFNMAELTIELLLAILTEKFIAFFAFLWLEWEVKTHHALSFLDHLPL